MGSPAALQIRGRPTYLNFSARDHLTNLTSTDMPMPVVHIQMTDILVRPAGTIFTEIIYYCYYYYRCFNWDSDITEIMPAVNYSALHCALLPSVKPKVPLERAFNSALSSQFKWVFKFQCIRNVSCHIMWVHSALTAILVRRALEVRFHS